MYGYILNPEGELVQATRRDTEYWLYIAAIALLVYAVSKN